MNASRPSYEIVYNGKNITTDILPYVLSFTYTDKASEESDELEIVVEDSSGLWSSEWYPIKGDSITARIFHMGRTLECGTFMIDELSATGGSGGDTVSIRALAAGIDKRIRTKNSYAHENKTLREIANTIATQHGLTVSGDIENVRIGRITQYRETDLKFLHRLASDYGYTFSIRGNSLVFTHIFKLENKQAALTLAKNEIISWSITDKTAHTFQASKVVYYNSLQKQVIEVEQQEDREVFKGAKSDTLILKVRAENRQQAEIRAKVALYKVNSLQQEGSLEIPGNVFALAGNNCQVTGLGVFGGLYYIQSSRHSVSKEGGYATSLEIKRVGPGDDSTGSTPSKPSIEEELKAITRMMDNLISASRMMLSMSDMIEKINEAMVKALTGINSKGYTEEYDSLNKGYERIQTLIREGEDLKAGHAAAEESRLAGRIAQSTRAK